MNVRSPLSSAFTLVCSGLASLLLLGCPTDEPLPLGDSSSGAEPMTTTGITACIPGQQMSCPCAGAPDGVQACLPDGSGLGPCECDAPLPLDDTGTTSTSGSSTGLESTDSSGTTAANDTTGGSESTSSGTTGDALTCDAYMSPPGLECDLWLQDCPANEKCMPWANDGGSSWNSTRCSPLAVGPGQIGDPCTVEGSSVSGIDSCDIGTMCWNVDGDTNTGVCNGLCNGCPDDASCDDAATVCVITNDGYLPLCLPGCDPLTQACPAGQGCYPVDDVFLCAPDASGAGGAYGDPCAFINVCDPGLVCLVAASTPGCGGAGCCSELCDVTDPAGDAQCMGAAAGQSCLAWYPMGMAPAGYEDVGFCSL